MATAWPVAVAIVATDENFNGGYCSVQRLLLIRCLLDCVKASVNALPLLPRCLTYVRNSCNKRISDMCNRINVFRLQLRIVEEKKLEFQIRIVVSYAPNSGIDLTEGNHDDEVTDLHH